MKEKWADLLDSRFVRGLTGMIFLFFNIFMLKFGVLLFIYPDYKWLLFFARILFIALYVFACIKIEKDYFSLFDIKHVLKTNIDYSLGKNMHIVDIDKYLIVYYNIF